MALSRCFKFNWLKRDLPARLSSSSLLLSLLFFYLTLLISTASESEALSHWNWHDNGEDSLGKSGSSLRTKRQHSDRYYEGHYGRDQDGYSYHDVREEGFPENYVLDEKGQREPETGPWGEWSAPSECSRSCGGGVSRQTRECHDQRPDGSIGCSGASSRFFSCNIHDCPEGSQDFRAEQCSQFNDQPFEGRKYEWVPYTKAPHKCELNCMPRGERFYYRHKQKVTDGTRCDDENHKICVDGVCQSVGCDMKLGSTAQEDKCRNCGGDGSNCNTVTGVFDQNNMQVGYNDILLIPAGATNIYVRESKPSNNYLAIRNVTGHYYLNGNWRIDFPSEISFCGTIFHYERKPHTFILAPESIRALGPITESLYIVILYQESNPGIIYEYSIPKGVVVDEREEYSWTFGDFSECSETCGGGYQSREIRCVKRSTMEEVESRLCDFTNVPAQNQTCNIQPCPIRWYVGPWEECDALCGKIGTQLRRVFCEQIVSGASAVVDDGKCEQPMPERMQGCRGPTECPTYFVGEWMPCDHLCGEGQQKRVVKCHIRKGNKTFVYEDGKCQGDKPEETRMCFNQPCEGVDWVTSPWSGCENNCGATLETREVYCATAKGKVYQDDQCHGYRKPEARRECEAAETCEFMWYATQWSKCTSTCGDGVQTRLVFCGSVGADGSITKTDESKCDLGLKYEGTKNCSGTEETCEATWNSGPWSKCSKECGGGQRTRSLVCMMGNKTVDIGKCGQDKIQSTSETCNDKACSGDEIMTTASLEVDDEDECDDYSDALPTLEMDATPESIFTEEPSGSGEMETATSEMDGTTGTIMDTDTTITDDAGMTGGSTMGTTEALVESSSSESSGSILDNLSSTISSLLTSLSISTGEASTEVPLSTVEPSSSSAPLESLTSSSTEGRIDTSTGGIMATTVPTSDSSTDSTESTMSSTDSSTMTSTDTTESSTVSSTETPMTTTESATVSTTVAPITTTSVSEAKEPPTYETGAGSNSALEDVDYFSDSTTDSSTSASSGSTESAQESTTGTGTMESSTMSNTDSGDSTMSEESTMAGSTETDVMVDVTVVDTEVSDDGSGTSEVPLEDVMDESTTSGPQTTLEMAITQENTARVCKPKTKPKVDCTTTAFGCCPNGVERALGPFGFGCPMPKTCKDTKYGCCPDGVSAAPDKRKRKCVKPDCSKTLFGCCEDGKNPAKGNDYEGCDEYKETCADSDYGCCPDGVSPAAGPKNKGCEEVDLKCGESKFGCCPTGKTAAKGDNYKGCKEINSSNCTASFFGCCADGKTPALGKSSEGCPEACVTETYGCCPDGKTSAHGPNKEGCCLNSRFGCCPDNVLPAQGAGLEGCGCQYSPNGCCPDNETAARGPGMQGCGCRFTEHGCCPDEYTEATGANYEGCPCQSFQFGCCPDGTTPAKGPNNEGCGCQYSEFSCCPDERTSASGPGFEGCGCEASRFGCCPDGTSEAKGQDFEGCEDVPINPGDVCGLDKERGSCRNFTVKWFFDMEYGGCSRFWYGGCDGNGNRFASQDVCKAVCVEPKGRDICYLPRVAGPCEGYYPSWYYDPRSERCEQFIYGGCLGNNNRFPSQELCQNTCLLPDRVDACDQPKTEGPCRGNYSRWYFDKETESCEAFQYGGCKGNNNNFLTERECHQRCKKEGRQTAQLEQCSFKREPGPCKGDLVRWYYDENAKTCMRFLYGGCGGNPNRFVSRAECLGICGGMDADTISSNLISSGVDGNFSLQVCFLSKIEGPCGEKLPRWHYDTNEQRCVPFYYGGCQGNANRFLNVEDCERTCPKARLENTCILPPSMGDCSTFTERYHYDPFLKRCREFVYTGCGGNANNFLSIDDCRSKCERYNPVPDPAEWNIQYCFEAPDAGPCNQSETKYYYDSRDGVCRQFRYGGCEGNPNRFMGRDECEDKCSLAQDICKLPAVPGPCRGSFPQWFYDAGSDSCSLFSYGGCQGNRNRFDSQTHCEQRCKKDMGGEPEPAEPDPEEVEQEPSMPELDENDICRLPVESGRCRDDRDPIPSWYFDINTGKCTVFSFSGCGGNANRYTTEEQCERQCGQFRGQDICHMTADIGPCRARIPKWFFDANDGSCRRFAYGGCEGNGNRFTSEEECQALCLSKTEILPVNMTISGEAICKLPVEAGGCSDDLPRWHYDADERTCKPFVYGGCGGNFNRFKNFDICTSFCSQFSLREGRNVGRERPSENEEVPVVEIEGMEDGDDTHASQGGDGGQPELDCRREEYECDNLQCPYGLEKFVADGGAGCTVCRCNEPCQNQECPEGSRCSVDVVNVPSGGISFRAVCRRISKPGSCPNLAPSRAGLCEQECQSDADCSADMKCCANGCGSTCLVPAHEHDDHDTNGIYDGTEPVAPIDPDGRGAQIVGGVENVEAEEGSLASLKCIARGEPEPSISWRKGNEKISTDAGRFRMLADGTLQIIGLIASDAGSYTCVADNGYGRPAQQTLDLNVTDPTPRDASVVDDSPDLIVSLGTSANIRCFAVGWPRPSVTWWRGDRMLPLSSERFEQRRDYSLLIRLVALRDLGPYTCQAYNGLGKAASWTVTLQAIGPVHSTNPEDREHLQYVVSQPRPPIRSGERVTRPPFVPRTQPPPRITFPTTTTTTTERHSDENEIDVPVYLVPLRTRIKLEKSVFATGSELSIPCEVEGYPTPRVLWYHEEALLPGPDSRARVLEDHTLVVSNATTSDSGTYRCEAINEYGAASTQTTVQVEGVYLHPNCTDNPFFANCKLIVKASYCTNRYYARFCCKSCTLAGQLPAFGPHLQEYGQGSALFLSSLASFNSPPYAPQSSESYHQESTAHHQNHHTLGHHLRELDNTHDDDYRYR